MLLLVWLCISPEILFRACVVQVCIHLHAGECAHVCEHRSGSSLVTEVRQGLLLSFKSAHSAGGASQLVWGVPVSEVQHGAWPHLHSL